MKTKSHDPTSKGRKCRSHSVFYRYDCFISYAATDKPFATKLALELQAVRYRIWLDETSVRPGHSIPKQVQEGLRYSRHIIVLMSRASMQSAWVEKEYLTQLMKDPANANCRIIPIRLRSMKPEGIPDFLRDLRHIQAGRVLTDDVVANVKLVLKSPMSQRSKKKRPRKTNNPVPLRAPTKN